MTQYSSVAQYLVALRVALKGAAPGMIADAMADCEEHLRGALAAHPGESEQEVFARMVESYGSPEEVAAGYRAIEMPQPSPFAGPDAAPVPASARRPWTLLNVVSDPATYGALLYMLLALATGVFYFVWATVGVSLSAGLFVLIIGIPFFLVFIASVRMLSYMEGRIVETLLGVRMPRRLPSTAPAGGLMNRIGRAVTDLRTWSSLFYMFLMLPLGVIYFTIAVTGLSLSLGLAFGGIVDLFVPGTMIHIDGMSAGWFDLVHSPLTDIVFSLLGVLLFFVMLHVARGLGRLHGRIAEHLLVGL